MPGFDLPTLINSLQRQQFYGSLELKLEAGRIVLLKQTQTFKPSDDPSSEHYRDNRGTKHELSTHR